MVRRSVVVVQLCGVLLAGNISFAGGDSQPEKLPHLIDQVKSTEPRRRAVAAWRIGRLGRKAGAAVPALMSLAEDDDLFARREAVDALGRIGPAAEAAIPALLKLLGNDKDLRLRG